MSLENVGKVLEGLKRHAPSFRGLHLAGGEPLLKPDLCIEVIRLARELRVPLDYLETNAFWASDDGTAEALLARLKEAGLPAVLISASPFHLEFIPFERTERAVRTALRVFGPEGVYIFTNVFYTQFSVLGIKERLSFHDYLRIVGERQAGQIIASGYSLIPGGRAPYHLGFLYPKSPAESFVGQGCRAELSSGFHVHVDNQGNYITGFCAGISMGNGFDLDGLFSGIDLRLRPVLRMLVQRGPYELFRFARREFDYEEDPGGYIAKCHLCLDVRRHLVERTSSFKELAPRSFYENL